MGWFDGGDDSNGYGGMMPSVQQAYARDPRQMMIQAMMQGTQEPQGRVVSPWSILSRALSAGLAGYSMNSLQGEYSKANDEAQKTMQDAIKFGNGYTDENGQAVAPDQNKMVSAMMGNRHTAPQGMQFAMSSAQAKSKARSELEGALMKEGMILSPDGVSVTRLPGWGGAKGRNEQDISYGKTYGGNLADIQTKPQLEGAVTEARNRADLKTAFPLAQARSGGTASGALPYAGLEAAARFYAVPHEVGPGASLVQLQQPGWMAPPAAPPGQVTPPRLLPQGAPATTGEAAPVQPNGATTVYANPNPAPGTQQGKFEAGRGEINVDALKQWHTEANAAAGQNQELNNMQAQLDAGLKTGTGFDASKWISNSLATAGIDPTKIKGLMDPSQAAQFDSGIKNLLIERAKAFGANPSNAEGQRIEASIVNASSPTEAVKSFMDWMRQKNDLKIQKFQQGYDAIGKGIEPLKFDLEWTQKYGPGAKAAADAPRSAPTISTEEEYAKLAPGTEYVAPDGKVRVKK